MIITKTDKEYQFVHTFVVVKLGDSVFMNGYTAGMEVLVIALISVHYHLTRYEYSLRVL